MLCRQIEKPTRGDVVNANQVRTQLTNQREIFCGLIRSGERFASSIAGEWPVCDTFEIKLLGAATKKFPVHGHARAVGKQIGHSTQTLSVSDLVTRIRIANGPRRCKRGETLASSDLQGFRSK